MAIYCRFANWLIEICFDQLTGYFYQNTQISISLFFPHQFTINYATECTTVYVKSLLC